MSKRLIEVVQGDTTPLIKAGPKFDGERPDLDASWSCRTALFDEQGNKLIDKAVTNKTQDNKRFIVALTPDETAMCAPGTYVWVVEIRNPNTNPPFNVEEDQPLRVKRQKYLQ